MLKRYHPPKNDHLFLADSETDSDDNLNKNISRRHLHPKARSNDREKSIRKEGKRSHYQKKTTIANGKRSQDRETFKEQPEKKVIKEAKRYQEQMNKFPIPEPISVQVSPESSFITWQELAESTKRKYKQPLHYLTQIVLKQWDESRGHNNEMVKKKKKRPIGNVIDPSKAEATVWVMEQFHRQFASHHYIAKLWLSDPKQHHFVDDLKNYSSP